MLNVCNKCRRTSFITFLFLGLCAVLAGSASAQTLQLQLQEGAAVVTIPDNGATDVDPTIGRISYVGPVGTFTSVNVFSGTSKPLIGTPTQAHMDILVSIPPDGTSGTLTIRLTDTNFPGVVNGSASITSSVGGSKQGGATGATIQAYLDSANTAFATAGPSVCTPGPQVMSTNPFSSTLSTTCPLNGPFSITTVDVVTLTANGSIGFDHDVTVDTPVCGTIGDFVWYDVNHNGLQDAGEPGINGVKLLLESGGSTIATTTTGPHPIGGAPGYYQFPGACEGTYTVQVDPGTLPAGFTATLKDVGPDDTIDNDSDGGPVIVTLPFDGASDQTIDFGFESACTGSIGDFVWNDLNQNGIQDPSEPGIDGVLVHLVEGNQTTITGPNGYYQFSGLCAGTYTVEIPIGPAGMTPTLTEVGDPALDSNPNPTVVVFPTDDASDQTIDFGYYTPCTGMIGDFVWTDLNRDGVQDPGEPGIQGVKVSLKNGVGMVIATTFTDANGFYSFSGLCGGDYTVEVDPASIPPTLTPSPSFTTAPDKDSNGSPASVTLPAPNSVDLTIDFGYMPPCAGIIGNFVWNDLNVNGIQDPGEPGIAGVPIELRRADNSLIAVTTTDASGFYQFVGLCGGDYKVVVVPPAGFPYLATPSLVGGDTTIDSNGSPAFVTLPNDFASDLTIDFGYWQPAALGDFVWRDNNANGVQDGGEPGIAGVSVTLVTCDGLAVASTATDVNGLYLFTNLMPGCYKVLFAAAAGLIPSPANVGGDATDSDSVGGVTGPYTLVAGETNLTVDAGFYLPAALGDFVWKDLNANGVQDAGEPGIAGVSVSLYPCASVVAVASTVTNGSGLYLFSNLVPGCYYVTFGTPAGFAASPANVGADNLDSDSVGGTTGNYVLGAGETNLTVDAGFYKLASLGDFVWKDLNTNGLQDVGEPGIPGVLVTLLKCDGTPTGMTDTTDASGFYLFTNLAPGCYKVQFATPAGYTPSPANVGANDAIDSDAVGGVTGNYTLNAGDNNLTVDAGFFQTPPICITATFNFATSSGSGVNGPAGNIRTFSAGGVNVHASAFGQNKSTGAFGPAFLGHYSHGLGVTDSSENGSNNTHVVDNSGQNNYVLFEFSQLVTLDKAFLDYIVSDSDVTVWIGTVPNVYTNHLNLNAAVLGSLGFTEVNLGGGASRWAELNAGGVQGNVVVIAAKVGDSVDGFKLSKIAIGCPPATCPPVGKLSLTGSSSTYGSAGNVRNFSISGVNVHASAFSRTDSSGSWATAFLGAFSGGLGVTDGSEGNGSDNRHKVDNIGGRNNYVLFEFSQAVEVDSAFLDVVGADSDISVWIGNKTDPYTSHLTLSDALLASLQKEDNATPDTSSASRWANINGAKTKGNVLVISALVGDTSPEDAFKLSKLDIVCK